MAKYMNGINYKFTKEEIEALADLLLKARQFDEEGERLSEIIATALNRNAFKTLNIKL